MDVDAEVHGAREGVDKDNQSDGVVGPLQTRGFAEEESTSEKSLWYAEPPVG